MKILLILSFSLLSFVSFSQSIKADKNVNNQLSEMTEQYALTVDQTDQLEVLLMETNELIQLAEKMKSDDKAYRAERYKINKQYHESLNKLLTAEQIAKYKEAQQAARMHFSKQSKNQKSSQVSGGNSNATSTSNN